jgi:DNA-binding Lrp family transcriptional regulator
MLTKQERLLLAELSRGLPICSQPYAEIGKRLNLSESEVLTCITHLKQRGLIKRFGVIVKHAPLGYRANAMVVWHIPENKITELGQRISQFDFVTLCYQRPIYPEWNYNLYCMIHGKDREKVLTQIAQINNTCQLVNTPQQVLFSKKCFKQRGAVY